jgi:ribA/ribD-fused uncharacterized protein
MITQITRYRGDKRFLSNFYEIGIYYKGVTYKTLEHAFQAQKTLSLSEKAWVAIAEKPGDAKYRGSQVHVREDWDQVKDGIMLDLLKIKFSNSELLRKLKETGNSELIEGNYWHDNW